MAQTFTTTGLIATDPRLSETSKQDSVLSFRLASVENRFNPDLGKWESGSTNWFTVVCFRQLATHCSQSLAKGDRIVVRGKLKVRDWDNGERSGTTVEIEADAIGHDLKFGIASIERTTFEPEEDEEDVEAELQPA